MAAPQEWLSPPNIINVRRELSFDFNNGNVSEAIDMYKAAFGGEIAGSYGHKSENDPAQLALINIGGIHDVKFTEEKHGLGYKAPANTWVILQVDNVTNAINTILGNGGNENETREIDGNRVVGRVKDCYGFGWILTPQAN